MDEVALLQELRNLEADLGYLNNILGGSRIEAEARQIAGRIGLGSSILAERLRGGPEADKGQHRHLPQHIQIGRTSVVILEAVYLTGTHYLNAKPEPLPILQGGEPVKAFAKGWSATRGYIVDNAFTVLSLAHDDGRRSIWYLDTNFNYITNLLSEFAAPLRLILHDVMQAVVSDVCQLIVFGSGPFLPPQVFQFAADMSGEKDLIDQLVGNLCPGSSSIVLEDSAGKQEPAALAAIERVCGKAPHSAALRAFFRQDLLSVQIDAARTGVVTMPSPMDGTPMVADAVWCLEPDGIVFRFPGADPRDTFFAVLYGFQMTLFGVYLPYHNLCLHLHAGHQGQMQYRLGAQPERGLWKHVLQFADCIPRPAAAPRTPVFIRSYDHIGHHIWNELGGLAESLRLLGTGGMPSIIVADSNAVEMWGKIDAIYPELAGKVSRVPTVRAAIRQVYETGAMPLRPTSNRVGRDLAERIIGLSRNDYIRGMPERCVSALRNAGYRFVVLGLRVENRTIVDYPLFCQEVIEMLAETLGRVAVIIDGQNCSDTGLRYRVTFQEAAKGSPDQAEAEIIAHLNRHFAGNPNVAIISSVGLPVGASVAICAEAECFVTPWGAALAKYRWACNLPGLSICGPSCERFQPIHIYDDPVFMESPTAAYFMGPGEVEDAPDDPVLMPGGMPDRVNVRVNKEALRRRIAGMLNSLRGPVPAAEAEGE